MISAKRPHIFPKRAKHNVKALGLRGPKPKRGG